MGVDAGQLRALSATLATAGAAHRAAATAVVAKTAADIEATAKNLAPVDTGTLKSSITRDVRGLEAEIGPTVNYALYVEAGTSRAAPQPFLGPATDMHTPEFEAALGKITGGIL